MIFTPSHMAYATESEMLIFRAISCSSLSVTVLPSTTLPRRSVACALNKIASTTEVLPSPLWPMTAMLRMLLLLMLMFVVLP